MRRLMSIAVMSIAATSIAAATLMFSTSAYSAQHIRVTPAHRAIHVQGFYRVDPFYDWPGSYWHQYPNTLFGYPNYEYSYIPMYQEYSSRPNCDFVWGKRGTRKAQRGVWTCS
jgi:hypothetical protein